MYYLLLLVQVVLVILWVTNLCSIQLKTLRSEALATRPTHAKSKGSFFPFCLLLKLSIFSTILTTFFGFSFSGICFLLSAYFKSIYPSLMLFTNSSFLSCLALIKSFTKNKGFSYLKKFKNVSLFICLSSAIISLISSCCNFKLDVLSLVGSVATSGVGLRVGILSKF